MNRTQSDYEGRPLTWREMTTPSIIALACAAFWFWAVFKTIDYLFR